MNKKIIGIIVVGLFIITTITPVISGNHLKNQSQTYSNYKNTSKLNLPPWLCAFFLTKANNPDTKCHWLWFFLYEKFCN